LDGLALHSMPRRCARSVPDFRLPGKGNPQLL
jgi:hypothetical protein